MSAHIFTDIIEVDSKQYILTQTKSFKSYEENKLQDFASVFARDKELPKRSYNFFGATR